MRDEGLVAQQDPVLVPSIRKDMFAVQTQQTSPDGPGTQPTNSQSGLSQAHSLCLVGDPAIWLKIYRLFLGGWER